MKKIIALLLVVVFVLSLAACGNGEPTSNPPEEDPVEKQYQEIKRFLTDVNDNIVDFNVEYLYLYSF